jgi:hypothetical protein
MADARSAAGKHGTGGPPIELTSAVSKGFGMNHPTLTDWLEWLYDEADPARRAELTDHLDKCAECRVQVTTLRQTRQALDVWKVTNPKRTRRPDSQVPVWPALLRWAAAAAVLLLGFVWGRSAGTARQSDALKQEISTQVRRELAADFQQQLRAALAVEDQAATNAAQRELRTLFQEWATLQAASARAEFAQAAAELAMTEQVTRAEDLQVLSERLRQLEEQTLVGYRMLKRDLDTVAVVADGRLQRTENQLGQLISFTQPEKR